MDQTANNQHTNQMIDNSRNSIVLILNVSILNTSQDVIDPNKFRRHTEPVCFAGMSLL